MCQFSVQENVKRMEFDGLFLTSYDRWVGLDLEAAEAETEVAVGTVVADLETRIEFEYRRSVFETVHTRSFDNIRV